MTLELDPSSGQLREPLLKLLHTLRSLEFVPYDGLEVELDELELAIGQQIFASPSVFNCAPQPNDSNAGRWWMAPPAAW